MATVCLSSPACREPTTHTWHVPSRPVLLDTTCVSGNTARLAAQTSVLNAQAHAAHAITRCVPARPLGRTWDKASSAAASTGEGRQASTNLQLDPYLIHLAPAVRGVRHARSPPTSPASATGPPTTSASAANGSAVSGAGATHGSRVGSVPYDLHVGDVQRSLQGEMRGEHATGACSARDAARAAPTAMSTPRRRAWTRRPPRRL